MTDALPDNRMIARKLGGVFLYFAGFALIAGPVFHAFALLYEYVSHAYTFLTMDAALAKLAAQCQEAVATPQEDGSPHPFPNSCDNIPTSSGMTWEQYWDRNPIGINWHFFLGISPQVLVALAAVWGGYRLGHPRIAAQAPEEMTPAQTTGLFMLVCGGLMFVIAYGFALAGGFKDPGPSRVVNATFGESAPQPEPPRDYPQEYEIAKIMAMIGAPFALGGIAVRRYARGK